ncbi:MAG: fumarate hydratase [Desulfotomaculales bacterium]
MRKLSCRQIEDTIARLCQEANYFLGEDVVQALERAYEQEISPAGKNVLAQLLENARIAFRERIPLCQDTGITLVFLEIGQDIQITEGDLGEAVNNGVRQGYREGFLRKSVVNDPLRRQNTMDNTPAIVHCKIVPGDALRLTVMPKGAGSENTSAVRMLKPADGVDGVKRFVIETVSAAGPNACPPLVIGVGIGGTMELAALLAKEALLRPLGARHPDPQVAQLERELLEAVNALGIGPMGFGGRVTALDVCVNVGATHIASLPVAVNLSCHAIRHKTAVL